jgi:hypothetical protein
MFFNERVASNPPFVDEIDLTSPGPFSNPWSTYPGCSPFPLGAPAKNSTFPLAALYTMMPPNVTPTYMSQWSVSYQRQLGHDWMASATYLGNKTTHIWVGSDINPAVFIPGTCGSSACSTTANTQARRVFNSLNPSQGPYFASFAAGDYGGDSRYNGLLTSLQHRFSHGFTVLANYTWSHCTSDVDFGGAFAGSAYENPNSRSQDHGSCSFDVPQVFNASFVGTSPMAKTSLIGRVLGGWQWAPLLRAFKGAPVNITTGSDNSRRGIGLDRPNLVLADVYNASWGPALRDLNAAAFQANAVGTFGNLGRNVVRAPGTFDMDMALSRIFLLREGIRLEARGEAFNVINHANFNAPTGNLSSANFGRILTAGDPRILQVALKLVF